MTTENPLKALSRQGQAIWMDYIRRNLIASGELKRLRDEDMVSGITSNPTIFEKAIIGSSDYDESLREFLLQDPDADSGTLYERLVIEDLQKAADVLRPVYDRTGGNDGFVSLEVSPGKAHATSGTIDEARRLWKALSRPNVMIKVPATREGLPAIEQLTAEGINVNVTLMFSLSRYVEVAQAYIRGLENCRDPRRVSSVASFFVSRVDTKVDRALEKIGSKEALSLQGKIAIANSRLVYRKFLEIFGFSFEPLRKRGARIQKPLWASTSTKNPAYRDVLYVEELIGSDTVDTMPPATLNAFRDHGKVRGATIKVGDPRSLLDRLANLGIDLDTITDDLLKEGIEDFAKSFEKLLAALGEKKKLLRSGQVDKQEWDLGKFKGAVEKRLQDWKQQDLACKIWRKDPFVWSRDPNTKELTDRLGWLYLPQLMREQIGEIKAFAGEIKDQGYRHVVLLGMGGSSLAPEVLQETFGNAQGYPELMVLDSTHPTAIKNVGRRIEPLKTLFLVSSKSGTTLETLTLFYYFWGIVSEHTNSPGRNFVAITDPGTPLAQSAQERQFRRIFLAPLDVGGRYSALSVFGLVPAALIGMDVDQLLEQALQMAEACASCVDPAQNPGTMLGAALGELGISGRDKLTFVAGEELATLPLWLEQLVAESTGKDNKGLIPIAGETLGPPEVYGADRFFVGLSLEKPGTTQSKLLQQLESAGHPILRIGLTKLADLGQEFFRWEFAIAAAGAALGIHPFDQPDVQLAQDLARKAMESKGTERENAGEMRTLARRQELSRAVKELLKQCRPGDYIALQAYLAPDAQITAALEKMRDGLRDRLHVATTIGYGPRFLHSTGQLHKGGPNTGLFLQFVDQPLEDLEVPEKGYSFGTLIRAQSEGDYQALKSRQRRVIRVDLGENALAGLSEIEKLLS